ncbi:MULTISPECIES: sulfurtransferase [unclassified Microbacterium]|uniref:sulfurtransferase n=1 Tax=unclassified Microbacterium TaxID=2609290 RepID=UPI0012FB9752|nr:rhodanese-like domain-containing protein [Microbacterium sp. MAH-37]MVQ41164.1 sulfurtransferase [Microbacterium sp. MAH-37]
MTDNRRRSLLISHDDAIPAGARFIETHFSHPEDWTPVIPGAVLASLENGTIAAAPSPGIGRFPLPEPEDIAAVLDAWGITPETPVVVYASSADDAKVAARAWFVLRTAGVADVRVLDGGAAGWAARTAEPGGEPAPASDVRVTAIDADRAGVIGATGVLLDARPAVVFEAGHIPGAVSAPGGDVFSDGRLLPDGELEEWAASYLAEADGPIAAYCGGGVAAAGTVFALTVLGHDAGLYVGSWSQWGDDPDRPVER